MPKIINGQKIPNKKIEEEFENFVKNEKILEKSEIKELIKLLETKIKKSSKKKEEIKKKFLKVFIFILNSFLNKNENELYIKKYKSVTKKNFYKKKKMENFEKKFLNQLAENLKISKIKRKKIIKNGLEDIFINTSEFFLKENLEIKKKSGMILNGNSGIGKKLLLEIFCKEFFFKIEKIDFSMFKNLGQIKKKYFLAVNNQAIDVKEKNCDGIKNYFGRNFKKKHTFGKIKKKKNF